MWTRDKITELLQNNDLAVERAVLVLFRRQTSDEQRDGDTRHHNGRGFTAAHAKLGTYLARWVMSNKHLSGHHLVKARRLVLHYTRQVTDQANYNVDRREIALRQEVPDLADVGRRLVACGIMNDTEASAWSRKA